MPKHPGKGKKTTLEGEFAMPWKFCASTSSSIKSVDFNFQSYVGM